MAELSKIVTAIDEILDDAAYTSQKIIDRINDSLQSIAAGIRMPDGQISPPLPDLYTYGVVNTSVTLPYVSLPADYQRNVIKIYDSSGKVLTPNRGGDYYAFNLFLNHINKLDLSEVGSVSQVAIKGSKIYYQGIPKTSVTIGLHYYRKPAILVLDMDIPEGIPEHLTKDLLKHAVIKDIYGDVIEAGVTEPSRGMQYHMTKFYESMTNLIDTIGIDSAPMYYGADESACDG